MRKRRNLLVFVCSAVSVWYLTLELSNTPYTDTDTYRSAPDQPFQIPGKTRCRQSLKEITGANCDRILKGDEQYIGTLSGLSLARTNTHCHHLNIPQDCEALSSRGYHFSKHVSDEELGFPLAFTLKVHKDPVQVEQLLRTIYRPHNVYCIHVDLKADKWIVDSLKNVSSCLKNVFVIQKVNVVYGSIGLLLSDIVCMKKLVKSKVHWKYYINLAGQEFPLKTNLEIVQILKSLNGRNDIESYPFPKRLYFRLQTSWITINNTLVNSRDVPKSPFKHKIPFYKGSMYGMFTRNFVRYVLNNPVSKDLISWCADTYAPEELVWATLNSLPGVPGGYNVTVSHGQKQFLSRAMIWRWDKIRCHGKFVRSVCVLGCRDLPWLVSSPEVVANKFHSNFDQLAIDCLEEWLYNKTVIGTTINMNWYYYRNVPHVKRKLIL